MVLKNKFDFYLEFCDLLLELGILLLKFIHRPDPLLHLGHFCDMLLALGLQLLDLLLCLLPLRLNGCVQLLQPLILLLGLLLLLVELLGRYVKFDRS